MEYRPYGNTGKDVSLLGFGGMRFTKDDDEGVRAVQRAFELGVNYFDTAPGYSDDRSEEIYGRAFRDLPKDQLHISTKSGVWIDKTAMSVRERLEQSLERMGVEKIAFYHMWCIITAAQFEEVMAPGGPYEEIAKAKDEGLVEHIVFSTHSYPSVSFKAIESGAFDGITIGYHVVNAAAKRPVIQAAHDAGMGVCTMNPLGGEVIMKYPEQFSFLHRDEDDTTVRACFRFNAAHPEISVMLSGMGTVAQVEENVAAVNAATDEAAGSEERLRAILGEFAAVDTTLCTLCQQCLPCPEGIPIPSYMHAIDIANARGNGDGTAAWAWHKQRGNFARTRATTCTDCGDCEPRCPSKIPIVKHLREAHELWESDSARAKQKAAAS